MSPLEWSFLSSFSSSLSSATGRTREVFREPSSAMLQRGQGFFNAVYGKVSGRVMGQMDQVGTQDLGLTARLAYGYLLSNTSVLSHADTSLAIIAALIPQDVRRRWEPEVPLSLSFSALKQTTNMIPFTHALHSHTQVNPQLKGHLKGALNGGASVDEVRAVRGAVIDICEAAGMERLDEGAVSGWGWREDVANLQ